MRGAKVDVKDRWGCTPCDDCIPGSAAETVLLKAGCCRTDATHDKSQDPFRAESPEKRDDDQFVEMIEAADVDVEVIVQAGLDQSVHTTKSKNLRRGSIQSRKRVAKKQPSPAAMPSFYQHQAGGNHAPPDRQQSMDNCKCTIC